MTNLKFDVYLYGIKKYQVDLFDRTLIISSKKEEILRKISETIDLFEDTNKPKKSKLTNQKCYNK